ncbi:hypothetical protein [Pedobacter mendelii]|uniref:DKNYY family protein n=1 Tax=Pedobacter mendelii TaxID=1908240 RepID=A0ABQ2BMA9_9SPHI|nr:hypothetical protein [Pedobacter mendelii]GGI29554.1 hypothetical protein GCM10008119_38200 [Pedobacter mendelii]
MSTTIKFTNSYGEQISSQQAESIEYYLREEYEDDFGLRKKIRYNKGAVVGTTHYLKNSENPNDLIINSLAGSDSRGFYFNKQIINGYTIWDIESFKDAEKIHKAKEVWDSKNRTLAYQQIEIHSNAVIGTRKYFYLEDLGPYFSEAPSIPDNGVFEFDYNFSGLEPGEIFVVINLMLYMDVGGGGFNINPEENIFLEDSRLASVFTWLDHPYYHNATPLIPTNQSV